MPQVFAKYTCKQLSTSTRNLTVHVNASAIRQYTVATCQTEQFRGQIFGTKNAGNERNFTQTELSLCLILSRSHKIITLITDSGEKCHTGIQQNICATRPLKSTVLGVG